MNTYEISDQVTMPGDNSITWYELRKPLLQKLKKHFAKYNNMALHHEYYDNSFSRVSFSVNNMKNILFAINLGTSDGITFKFIKEADIENTNSLASFQPSITQIGGDSYKIDNVTYTDYNIGFTINAFEKDNRLIAFLPHYNASTMDDAMVFDVDCNERKYMYIAYANKLYYDDVSYVPYTCYLDNIPTNIDGYVYLKKGIPIRQNNYIYGINDTIINICNSNLGTSTNNTYLNLIDVKGIKYRQLKANIWIEDKEE